jgi:hypothetical protein
MTDHFGRRYSGCLIYDGGFNGIQVVLQRQVTGSRHLVMIERGFGDGCVFLVSGVDRGWVFKEGCRRNKDFTYRQ